MRLIEAGGQEDGRHGQDVSYTDKHQTTKTISPAVQTAAFAWCSAAAALPWLPSHGREEECERGVSATDENTQ